MTDQDLFTSTSQVLLSPRRNAEGKNRRLSPNAFQSFLKTWDNAVKDIPIPSWCTANDLAQFLAQETEQYYIEKRLDDRYERLLKISRNAGELFISYANGITDYSKAMIAVLRNDMEQKPRSLYRSDFPLSIITKLDLLKHTQVQAYDCLSKLINSFTSKAALYKGNHIKFHHNVSVPASEKINPLVEAFNASDKASSALLAYIRIWNVERYEELLVDQPLSKEKLDSRILSTLYQNFEERLYYLRNVLARLAPEIYVKPRSPEASTLMLSQLLSDNLP